MTKKQQSYPPEIGKSKYNRESGNKTLALVGVIISLIVLLCIITFLLLLHIL